MFRQSKATDVLPHFLFKNLTQEVPSQIFRPKPPISLFFVKCFAFLGFFFIITPQGPWLPPTPLRLPMQENTSWKKKKKNQQTQHIVSDLRVFLFFVLFEHSGTELYKKFGPVPPNSDVRLLVRQVTEHSMFHLWNLPRTSFVSFNAATWSIKGSNQSLHSIKSFFSTLRNFSRGSGSSGRICPEQTQVSRAQHSARKQVSTERLLTWPGQTWIIFQTKDAE